MMQVKQVSKDQYLIREGDKPSGLFIVKSGAFAITQFKSSGEFRYGDLASGETFGESGLFEPDHPYELNVKALQNSEVIVVPYADIHKQIETIPPWMQIIFKNLITQLKKTFPYKSIPPSKIHTGSPLNLSITKYLSMLNLVSLSNNNRFTYSQLRNYTIQIFQETTAPLSPLTSTLADLGYLSKEELEGGEPNFVNLKPKELTHFVEWYNEWLFKPERQRLALLKEEEVSALEALIRYAKTLPVNSRGFTKINLNTLQTESEAKVGRAVRKDDIVALVTKRYFAEPVMEESGVTIQIPCDELEYLAGNCSLVNSLTKVFSEETSPKTRTS